MKNASLIHRTPLFLKDVLVVALLALAATLTATAQQTVFYDNFSSSTLNSNSIPTGTPTASATSYDLASSKNATSSTIASGDLSVNTSATSSGGTEAQAVFTKYPVTLQATNDYIELDYTFLDSTDVLNGLCGNGVGLYCGLFNSGGVPPLSGGVLDNGGLGSATSYDAGGTVNWVGYNASMLNSLTGLYKWSVGTRPVQTTFNNNDQAVLYNYATGGTSSGVAPTSYPFPDLVVGQPYTVQFRITLTASNTLTVSNAMYPGAVVGGTMVWSNQASFTGANFLTTNFDSLGVGYRAGDSQSIGWTNGITSITVIAGLAAQAGPYFTMTSSGNGCGGATVGLNGSVMTNVYYLYDNGTNTGQSVLGTGSAISFGMQSVNGTYTIIASNTVTGSEGPMYGSQAIFVGMPTITSEPVSVTCVTNIPATFSVSAVGASLTYQWYKDGIVLTNGGDVSGALTTNLVINPTQAGDVASYFCVAQDPCGDVLTSTPNATLTLIPPHNLVWQGGADGNWDFNEANFTNQSGVAEIFTNGDDVTFNDTSGDTSVDVTNAVTSTLVTVNSSEAYTFNGTGKITGFSQLVVEGSGGMTIGNLNDYTGGTSISNGATLTLGTGSGASGTVAGIVNIAPTGTLNYSYANSSAGNADNIANGFAGSGTVNVSDASGATVATPLAIISSNFDGTINIQGYTSLHASNGNLGDPLGYGSTINAPDNTQIWLDQSSLAYNMTFNIGGTGWLGATPQTGALRVYGCTVNGPINMMDNARIGGSINGATIQSVISGPYQLEIFGNTNSFVLVLGPTNGSPQNYSSTLITSGAISCANTNAVSTGLLTEDAGGDFQLNGHNITVADLTSINSGNVEWLAGPTVRNNNTTNAAVLTVGGDNNSEEYDGTFLDGAAAPLGLTKAGSGTFTVTAVNTNSGPVTVLGGSIALSVGGPPGTTGAFTKASLIAVGGGASFNVSGRPDETLTLNSGQKLAGQGTVIGNVAASSGATINPGLPTGTLTVSSGSVTMNAGSTYLANLNRNGSPNCGKLSASGGITYAGTLTVTNVGSGLQAGDTFQLFPAAVTTFSSIVLQTNDVVNNLKYTWNNNVAVNGQISVATVSYIINPAPTNIVYNVSGATLVLSWPPDHTGWTLQAQTNAPGAGLGTNWVNVAGSASVDTITNVIAPTNGSVFYRLIYQ